MKELLQQDFVFLGLTHPLFHTVPVHQESPSVRGNLDFLKIHYCQVHQLSLGRLSTYLKCYKTSEEIRDWRPTLISQKACPTVLRISSPALNIFILLKIKHKGNVNSDPCQQVYKI